MLYRTTDLFQKLFGLEALDALPDVSRFDPSPEDERELRERLLKAGEARAEQPGLRPRRPPTSSGWSRNSSATSLRICSIASLAGER